VFIPEEEMGDNSPDRYYNVMVDEASGRVLIWGWGNASNTKRLYIWDLV